MFQKLSFKDYFLGKKRKNKIYIFTFLILSLSIFLYKNKTPLIQSSHAVLKMGRSYLNPDLYKDELLGSDFFVRGRAFASVVPINKGYLVYYSRINRFNKNITINLRKVKNLKDLKKAKSITIIDKHDAGVSSQVWMPYVFKEDGKYFMVFTARSGDYKTDNYLEDIRIAHSKDGIKWTINKDPILSPILPWEGMEVENWGVIKKNNIFYMSYESRGYSRKQINRSIGIAYSKNLKDWERLKDKPLFTDSEYCSVFFRDDDYIYHLVPNNKRFKVYRAKNFLNFSNNSFIGYWDPLGKGNNYLFDSPEIVTPDIRKKINNGSTLEILYSVLLDEGWVTKIIKYENLDNFLENLNPL